MRTQGGAQRRRGGSWAIILALLLTLVCLGVNSQEPSVTPTRTSRTPLTVKLRLDKANQECAEGHQCEAPEEDFQAAFNKLIAWLKQNNATISDEIEWPQILVDAEGTRGFSGPVKVKRSFKGGDVLVSIPKNLVLKPTEELKLKWRKIENDFKKILDADENPYSRFRPKDLLLALAVVDEVSKMDDSFFRPYLDALPSVDDNRIIETWSNTRFVEFQDKNVQRAQQLSKGKLKQLNEGLLKHNIVSKTGLGLLEAAMNLVRLYASPFTEKTDHDAPWTDLALIPLFDVFTVASKTERTVSRYLNGASVTLATSLDIESGEVASIYHGPYSNFYMVVNQGYASLDNPEDGYSTVVKPFHSVDPLRNIKEGLWNVSNPPNPSIVILQPFEASQIMLGFMRLLVATVSADINESIFTRPTSPDEEDIALNGYHRAIAEHLERFQTPLEDDEAMLERKDVIWASWKQAALKYRIARKRIVARHACFAKTLRTRHAVLMSRENLTQKEYLSEYEELTRDVEAECFI